MDLFFPVSHLNTFVLAACFGGLEATQQVAIFSSDYLTRLIYISIFFFRNASTFGWAPLALGMFLRPLALGICM